MTSLTKYYSDTLPYMLIMFPNLRQLDLGAGMVSTFTDHATDTGQCWQPVLNILRRNNGALKAVLQDEMLDPRRMWDSRLIRAEVSIKIPARGKMLLKEAVWTLQEISAAAQVIINETDPVPSFVVSRRGNKYDVRFIGIPIKVKTLYWRKEVRKWEAKKLHRAQQNRAGDTFPLSGISNNCICKGCEIRRKVRQARATLTKNFNKRWGGREPKWARNPAISCDDECPKRWREGRPKWARRSKDETQVHDSESEAEYQEDREDYVGVVEGVLWSGLAATSHNKR